MGFVLAAESSRRTFAQRSRDAAPDVTPERWHRIEGLFHAAAERSTRDRDAFLIEACGADLALRREVDC